MTKANQTKKATQPKPVKRPDESKMNFLQIGLKYHSIASLR